MPQQIVQVGHACIDMTRCSISQDHEHPHLVVLGVNNEHKLSQVVNQLEEAGILFQAFVEPDIGNQLTAVATAPVVGAARKFFRKFQLLKGN